MSKISMFGMMFLLISQIAAAKGVLCEPGFIERVIDSRQFIGGRTLVGTTEDMEGMRKLYLRAGANSSCFDEIGDQKYLLTHWPPFGSGHGVMIIEILQIITYPY